MTEPKPTLQESVDNLKRAMWDLWPCRQAERFVYWLNDWLTRHQRHRN